MLNTILFVIACILMASAAIGIVLLVLSVIMRVTCVEVYEDDNFEKYMEE